MEKKTATERKFTKVMSASSRSANMVLDLGWGGWVEEEDDEDGGAAAGWLLWG